tara:strand:- start:18168 stop:20369 length:2202 start_codon:yes stop_codon:yes gene_type:complete
MAIEEAAGLGTGLVEAKDIYARGRYAGWSDDMLQREQQMLLERADNLKSERAKFQAGWVSVRNDRIDDRIELLNAWIDAKSVQSASGAKDLERRRSMAATEVISANERALIVRNMNSHTAYLNEITPGINQSIDQITTVMGDDATKIRDGNLGAALSKAGMGVEANLLANNNLLSTSPELERNGQMHIRRETMAQMRQLAAGTGASKDAQERELAKFDKKYFGDVPSEANWAAGTEEQMAKKKYDEKASDADAARGSSGSLGNKSLDDRFDDLAGDTGSLKMTAAELAGVAENIAAPQDEAIKKNEERMIAAESGNEFLPIIMRNMRDPSFVAIGAALGHPQTLNGAYRTMEFLGRNPGQAAKLKMLYFGMDSERVKLTTPEGSEVVGGRASRLTDSEAKKQLILRMYLENQAEQGMAQMSFVSEGKSPLAQKLFSIKTQMKSKALGYTDVTVGRIKQSVQGYVETNKWSPVPPTPDEDWASFTASLPKDASASTIAAAGLSYLNKNGEDLDPNTYADFAEKYLPYLEQGAELREEAEQTRKIGMQEYETTDLLAEEDAPLLELPEWMQIQEKEAHENLQRVKALHVQGDATDAELATAEQEAVRVGTQAAAMVKPPYDPTGAHLKARVDDAKELVDKYGTKVGPSVPSMSDAPDPRMQDPEKKGDVPSGLSRLAFEEKLAAAEATLLDPEKTEPEAKPVPVPKRRSTPTTPKPPVGGISQESQDLIDELATW